MLAAWLLRFWSDTYMAWPSLAFGVGPVLAAALGFLAAWGCVGALDAAGLATLERDGIRYGAKQAKHSEHSRAAAVRETEASVPYATQVRLPTVRTLAPSLSLSLSLSLSVCVPLCVPLYLSIYVSMYLSIYLSLSLYVSLCLSLSLSVLVCLSLYSLLSLSLSGYCLWCPFVNDALGLTPHTCMYIHR
jgi:hypothetical protein